MSGKSIGFGEKRILKLPIRMLAGALDFLEQGTPLGPYSFILLIPFADILFLGLSVGNNMIKR